jgi:hypothetical protein
MIIIKALAWGIALGLALGVFFDFILGLFK